MDWTGCALVERVPGRLSGVPVVKDTRVQADAIVENYADGLSVEEISEEFDLELATVKAILSFAAQHEVHLAS